MRIIEIKQSYAHINISFEAFAQKFIPAKFSDTSVSSLVGQSKDCM